VSNADLYETQVGGRTLGEALLEPTRIYVRPVLALMGKVAVKGLAHITGGGLLENIPRVIPEKLAARLEASRWPRPAIFDWLKKMGNIDEAEMQRTFNCGLGMVVVVARDEAKAALAALAAEGVEAWEVGSIVKREAGAAQAVVA